MKLSEQAKAAIALRVALKSIIDARKAWRDWRRIGGERATRAAFRACVLAARCASKASEAWSSEPLRARQLAADSKRLEAAAGELKHRLVKWVLASEPDTATK